MSQNESLEQLIYRPPVDDSAPLKPTFGVKFSQDVFLGKYYLDQKNIPYELEELEMTPFGLGLRIKRD